MALRRLKNEWLPKATMSRVITHWTVGHYQANATDLAVYHFLIEGDGKVVRGNHSIKKNQAPIRGRSYAAHTKNANSGSIGVSVCCMVGARRSPLVLGPKPMTQLQWNVMAEVVADLCETYGVAVTDKTVLGHGEVQKNLGKKQRDKWDPMVQPWATHKSFSEVGDEFRAMVLSLIAQDVVPVEKLPVAKLKLGETLRNGVLSDGSAWMRISDARAMGVHVVLKSKDRVEISYGGATGDALRMTYEDVSYMTVRDLEEIGFTVGWDGQAKRVTVTKGW